MTGFYAMGGGLGHLTRVKTFIKNEQLSGPFKVITANRSAFDFFEKKEVAFIEADKSTKAKDLKNQIKQIVSDIVFEQLYIDTFPCGILGELTTDVLASKTRYLLTRRLIWKNYKSLLSQVNPFDSAYQFEPLEFDHQQFINENSKLIVDSNLEYGQGRNIAFAKPSNKLLWLVVHSSDQDELLLLINHAQDIARLEQVEPEFIVLSDVNVTEPHSYQLMADENPLNWYSAADRIFTGGGFNTWYQLAPWRNKHTALPFKRKFDDQFWRVSNRM